MMHVLLTTSTILLNKHNVWMIHLLVDEEVEDHEAEEGDKIHHKEIQPHDVDLDVIGVES